MDNLAKQVEEAGGAIFRVAEEDESGYYYCGIADPDDHKFNAPLVTDNKVNLSSGICLHTILSSTIPFHATAA